MFNKNIPLIIVLCSMLLISGCIGSSTNSAPQERQTSNTDNISNKDQTSPDGMTQNCSDLTSIDHDKLPKNLTLDKLGSVRLRAWEATDVTFLTVKKSTGGIDTIEEAKECFKGMKLSNKTIKNVEPIQKVVKKTYKKKGNKSYTDINSVKQFKKINNVLKEIPLKNETDINLIRYKDQIINVKLVGNYSASYD